MGKKRDKRKKRKRKKEREHVMRYEREVTNTLGIKKPKEEEASPIDEEKEALERTRKLRNEIQEHMEEEPNKRKRKKESV